MRKLAIVLVLLMLFSSLAVLTASAQASCPGSLPPMLIAGGRGQIAQSFSSLRPSVGADPFQTVYAPASFTVLAGPASDGFLCYFQIQYDSGATGWAVESQVSSPYGPNMYWLIPEGTQPPPPPPPPPPSSQCPGSLPTRLVVGGRGYLAQSFSSLRSGVGVPPFQTVYAPASFTVLAGPASDGFLCYFQIQYDNGLSGWAVESQVSSEWGSNMYWLAPS